MFFKTFLAKAGWTLTRVRTRDLADLVHQNSSDSFMHIESDRDSQSASRLLSYSKICIMPAGYYQKIIARGP